VPEALSFVGLRARLFGNQIDGLASPISLDALFPSDLGFLAFQTTKRDLLTFFLILAGFF